MHGVDFTMHQKNEQTSSNKDQQELKSLHKTSRSPRRQYLIIIIFSTCSFSWLLINRHLIPKEHNSIAPSRLTHGFGIPNVRTDDGISQNEKYGHLTRNYSKFSEEYGRYGEGVVNESMCLKEMLVYGSINNMLHYPEMAPLLKLFQQNVGYGTYSSTAHVACPGNCAVGLRVGTDSEYFINKDVVIFGMLPKDFGGRLDALSAIKPLAGQTWIYYSTESPYRVLRWVQDMNLRDIRYHKLMTYHMDSEIPRPFGYFIQKTSADISEVRTVDIMPNYAKNKTRLVAWMASNCEEIFWSRSMFVEELMVYIKVDLYGKCGSLKCMPRDSEECNWMLSKYKFYLALANSECRHYITEKFWKTALQHNIVPVIYGAPKVDIERFAPPNSYIHVGDFTSPEELAKYLVIIDQNDTLYNSFFEWKQKGRVISNFPSHPSLFCDILSTLDSNQAPEIKLKTLGDSPWWRTCRYDVNMETAVYTKHHKLAAQFKRWKPWNISSYT